MRQLAFASLLVIGILFISGCPRKDRPVMPMPPEPNPQPEVNKDAGVRTRDLSQKVTEFVSASREVPTNDEGAYRRAVGQVFGDLSQILPLLQGPNPPGAFRQQMRIVQSSRNQLGSTSQDLSADPTIDSGLRAVYAALVSVQQEQFAEQAELSKILETINARVNDLDTVRGPMHRETVKDAVTLIGQAVQRMSATMDQRMSEPRSRPATAPAT
jgi:hypothetical protein